MDTNSISSLSDEQINNYQNALAGELNRRLRVVTIPQQLTDLIRDARAGGEIPDATIREIFEDAMNADID